MGKTLTRDQRKNSKYIQRNEDRRRKNESFYETVPEKPVTKPRKKWKPHSEIEAD